MTASIRLKKGLAIALLGIGSAAAQEPLPGASVESLLAYARERNPEYAAMRFEADAAGERVAPAGALPDPRLRTELMDITRSGEQNPTLSPSRVGSTRYTLMQEIPWFGKRDLKREVAALEAEGARGRAAGTWAELSGRIKAAYAQYYYLHRNIVLTQEILDLLGRLEQIARARYAGGLAAQQDVVRAQVEQTNMRTELLAMETEHHHLLARLNALLARPAASPLAVPERLRPLPAPARLDHAALEERVRSSSPQLFTEEARLKAAEKSRDLTYKNRYPDVTFGFVPNQFQNSVKQWDLMLELNIPLQQGTRRAQERESEAMVSAAQARREATANQVLANLAENLAGIDTARRTERLAADSLLPQAQVTFQAALAGYETGKVDFTSLLDAQRQIRQARQNQIRAQAEAQARLGDIERILGEDL
ncbi:MAG: Outer rane efflux protein [Rhodocyclaceae bacterium]|nr:Outer rane efflux protein [Rhodocyclaceae bacterium]